MAADPSLSPELIEARSFTSGFRGYDQSEVRDFLTRVAAEVRTLRERTDRLESAWHSAEERAARPPVLDEETLIAAVGEETASILRAARTAASDLRTRAAQDAERMIADAQTRATEIRSEAEAVLTRETSTAEEAAARLIDAARSDAAEMVDKARGEADAVRSAAQQERNLTIDGAIATRERILDDLSRRRRVASVQIEQLRAGRERLLESYAVVRRTLEEVNDELNRADAEARAAADEVGRRMQRDHHPDPSRPPEAGGEVAGAATVASEAATADAAGEEAGSGEAAGEAGGGEAAQDRDRPAVGPVGRVATEPGSSPRRVPPIQASVLIPPGGSTRGGGEGGGPGGAEALAAAIDPVDDPGPPEEATATPHLRVVGDEPAAGAAGRVEDAGTTAARHSAPGSKVDVLFARIRAGRSGVHAHPSSGPAEPEVNPVQPALVPAPVGVEGTGAGGPDTEPTDTEPTDTEPTDTEPTDTEPAYTELTDTGPANGEPANAERTVAAGAGEAELSQADQDLLARRQAVLAGLESSLTRKLKRALQDEQNDLLDRLRSFRGEPTVVRLLPGLSDQIAHYAGVAAPFLDEAAAAGGAFAAQTLQHRVAASEGAPTVSDLATEAATTIVESLRRRLEHAIATSLGDEHQVLVEAVGSAYREWKSERLERIAGDVLAAAYARGTWHHVPAGSPLRWAVKDIDGPCPDCDDNALAGGLPKGEPFPTGQPYPPAHPGCRCLLVPIRE